MAKSALHRPTGPASGWMSHIQVPVPNSLEADGLAFDACVAHFGAVQVAGGFASSVRLDGEGAESFSEDSPSLSPSTLEKRRRLSMPCASCAISAADEASSVPPGESTAALSDAGGGSSVFFRFLPARISSKSDGRLGASAGALDAVSESESVLPSVDERARVVGKNGACESEAPRLTAASLVMEAAVRTDEGEQRRSTLLADSRVERTSPEAEAEGEADGETERRLFFDVETTPYSTPSPSNQLLLQPGVSGAILASVPGQLTGNGIETCVHSKTKERTMGRAQHLRMMVLLPVTCYLTTTRVSRCACRCVGPGKKQPFQKHKKCSPPFFSTPPVARRTRLA